MIDLFYIIILGHLILEVKDLVPPKIWKKGYGENHPRQ